MIRYHFDLYDDPEGALLVRFTQLQSAEYRGEANGTGAGRITIRATDAEAAFINPMGLQYIRVVRDDESTELVIGGFFTERGSFSILSQNSDKLLSIGGAGPLTYLQRGVMDADSWIDDPFIGTDPRPDGTWPLHLAGTGNELGAILWRVLHELEEPGRHQNPVPAMSLGFTHLLDSNGDPWVRTSGDFVAQVTDTAYSIAKRLMELGLYIEVDPDTFEVRAYEPETHRRDRTGATFGANVVRFQAGVNIKSDATRELEARIRRNALLVGSNDTWEWVTDPGVAIPWEGGYILDDQSGTSLVAAGEAQIAARSDAGDVFHFRMIVGDDPLNGAYLPFEHVKLDYLVTVHTGTGALDYDEQVFPVSTLTLTLRQGGDWDCWVDLGSTYTSMQERAFQAQPVKAHNHPPNPAICRDPPVQAGGVFHAGRFDSNFGTHDLSAWGDIEEGGGLGLQNTVLFIFIHPGPDVDPDTISISCSDGRVAVPIPGSTVVNGSWGQKAFYIVSPASGQTFTRSPNSGYCSFALYEDVDPTDPVLALYVNEGSGAVASLPTGFHGLNSLFAYGAVSATDPNETTGQTEFSPSDSQSFWQTSWGMSHGDGAPSWSLASSAWTIIGIAPKLAGSGSGGSGDLPADTVAQGEETFGIGTGAAACDHAHAHGLLSTSETHYHDYAHIEDPPASVTDHGALTGLGDDDHPQYLTSAEHTAADHSTLGYWEPVTNGDVGSPEIVFEDGDVVMEWVS